MMERDTMKKMSIILLALMLMPVLSGCYDKNDSYIEDDYSALAEESVGEESLPVGESCLPVYVEKFDSEFADDKENCEYDFYWSDEIFVLDRSTETFEYWEIELETALITIDGERWTFFPFGEWAFYESLQSETMESHNFTFLSDMRDRTVPWTFVREGDTFLDWKITSINSVYIFSAPSHNDRILKREMYRYPRGNEIVKFEGEVTIRAVINNAEEDSIVTADYEYLHLFPCIMAMPSYERLAPSFVLRNPEAVNGFGIYEAEITIKDFWIDWFPLAEVPRYNSAELVSIEILSVLEQIDDEAPLVVLPEYVPGSVRLVRGGGASTPLTSPNAGVRHIWGRNIPYHAFGIESERLSYYYRNVLKHNRQTSPWVQFIQHFDIPKWIIQEVSELEHYFPTVFVFTNDKDERPFETFERPNADILYTFDDDIINAFYRIEWDELLTGMGLDLEGFLAVIEEERNAVYEEGFNP
jgi:hypothetical protein